MLQVENAKVASAPSVTQTEASSPSELFATSVAFVRRQYPIILFVLMLTLALGTVYLFTAPTRYTGEAVLIIDTHKVQLLQQQSVVGDFAAVDSTTVDTQVEILKSESIALSVIKELHLTEDDEFTHPRGGPIGAVVRMFPAVLGSKEPRSEFQLTRAVLGAFQDNLTIRRIPMTYAIGLYYVSLSSEKAAKVANAVANAYIVDALDAKYQATRRAANWLQDRLKELREQASTAEQAALDYKMKNNIIDTGGRLLNEQQLVELNSTIVQARATTAEAQARLERVNDIIRGEPNGLANIYSATVTDSLHNEVVTHLRQQYLDLQAREHDWSRRFGSQHLAAVNLRNQMFEVRQSISDELHRIAETYKSDYEIAKLREEAAQKALADIVAQSNVTNQAQIALHDLESTAQTYRGLYENFLQHYMESVQQQSFPITEARVITQASPPLKKSYPKTLLVLAISIVGGLVLSLGAALLRDLSDRVFRTASQIETELQTDCLALLPAIKDGVSRSESLQVNSAANLPAQRTIRWHQSPLRHVVNAPLSRFAEGVRSIRVAADLFGMGKSNKVLGVTSSLPNEGKTTTAAALAQIMAAGGSRVILVDCDLRNPSLSRELTPSADVGLLEVAFGGLSVEDVVWIDPATKLAFLPMVAKVRVIHSSDILSSPLTKKLFESLRDRYDYVVVDLSPLAPVVDVRSTTNLVDSYILIVEWGRTKIDVVQHALKGARGVNVGLLGVVLNKADISVLRRYENYRGSFYYNRRYARYGYTD
jgi:succinoglycan biosynthesis transport protein ExoP